MNIRNTSRAFRRAMPLAVASLLAAFAATAGAAEIGVTESTVLLGQSAAFSGPAQQLGKDMNLGAKTYFQWVNERGGIFGRKIDLRTRDDGYEAGRAAENTHDFIEKDRVFALFGYVGTPTSNAALPIFTEAKVPFVGPLTGANSLREPFNRYVFNIRAGYFDETERIVEQLVTTGVTSIAVFYQNDAYGKAGLEGVTRAMTKRNLKIAATATVERNSVDVAAAKELLSKADPAAIVEISAYASCAALIKEMKKSNYTGQFINVSFVGSNALASALGDEGRGVVISQVMPFPFSKILPVQREYAQLMAKAGGSSINFGTMEGFMAAKVFTEALRRAGNDPTREKLITALESMRDFDIGGFAINFSPSNHNGSRLVELTMIGPNGEFLR
jgi:branched-chain amino acid transport system substrate-binding protein